MEKYLTDGIRYCAIFVKLTESMNDDLLVQYGNGTKRRVAGMFLFTDLDDATAWVHQRKQAEIDALDSQIYQLNVAKDKVYQTYAGINIEEKTVFTT